MLSIFTLSVLGSFGLTNALTDVTEHTNSDEDARDDQLNEDAFSEGLGGEEDLIERLDMYAALGMTPPPETPTSEAYLPAEDDELESAFDFMDEEVVANISPDEIDLIADDMAAAMLGEADPDAGVEVIPVSVGLPGTGAADATDATETGFRTALGPGDELTLNIAPDLPGQIVAVHSVFDTLGDDEAVGLRYSLNFYMQSEGQILPEGTVTGTEAEFIETHGLQKLGEVDMGRFEAHVDDETGDTVVTEDSRQSEPPHVIANRDVTEISALFS